MASALKVLSSLQTAILENDLRDDGGSLMAKAGETVVILPQTVAAAVLAEGDKTLAEVWPTISRTDHAHADLEEALAGYQAQLIRLTRRVTELETANKNGE